jgi:hypothetical protein
MLAVCYGSGASGLTGYTSLTYTHDTVPIVVVELDGFEKDAAKLWRGEERDAFIDFIARNPEKGQLIEGTGGVRKVRWSRDGSGKSGGVRVIYYFHSEAIPIYLLAIYAKGERADLSAAQKKQARAFVETLKATLMRKRQ